MAYFGITPQGNKATEDLHHQYKDYVFNQQFQGLQPVPYEEWAKQFAKTVFAAPVMQQTQGRQSPLLTALSALF